MKFTVTRNVLLAALNRAKCIIYPKGANNVFKTIVFSFPSFPEEEEQEEIKSVTIHTSDGQQWYSETIPVTLESKSEPVRNFSVWYHDFIRAIRSLDEQPLLFHVGEMQMSVTHDCGSFRLPLENSAEEFVAIPKPSPDADAADGFSMEYESPVLRSIFTKCSYAMAYDELRPALNGIYMNLTKDYSDYVSSDGHKLVRVRKGAIETNGTGDCCLIIPARTVRTLLRILPTTGDVLFEYQEKTEKKVTKTSGSEVRSWTETVRKAAVRITIDDTITFSFYSVDGKYPKYWTVISDTCNYEMVINRRKLIKSIDRLSIFADSSSEMLRLFVKEDVLNMTCSDKDLEADGEETLSCDYRGVRMMPTAFRIGMKASSLSATLKHLSSEEVVLKFIDSSQAVLILPQPQPDVEEVTMLLMPMMIND